MSPILANAREPLAAMFDCLLVGGLMLVINVTIEAIAGSLLVRLMAALIQRGFAGPKFWSNVAIINAAMLILLLAGLIQMALWAVLFMICGAFTDYATAFYFSATNFTTLGYGDVVLTSRWRLLGPLEAANGALMFGVAASMLFAVVSRVMELRLRHQRSAAAPKDA